MLPLSFLHTTLQARKDALLVQQALQAAATGAAAPGYASQDSGLESGHEGAGGGGSGAQGALQQLLEARRQYDQARRREQALHAAACLCPGCGHAP